MRGRSAPLSRAEQVEAEQVAGRLRSELRSLLSTLPPDQQGASRLAKRLRMDRATCQRIVSALRADRGAVALVELPGVDGLRLFAESFARRVDGQADGAGLVLAAVDRFDQFLRSARVSQRSLRRLLAEPAAAAPVAGEWLGQDDPVGRRALFLAARNVMGRWSERLVGVSIIAPVAGDAGHTQTVQLRAHLGHHSLRSALPFELGSRAQGAGETAASFTTLDPPQEAGPWGVLVAPFSSAPLPRIATRRSGGTVTHVVETVHERPTDVVIATRSAHPEVHPAARSPAIGEVSTIVRNPAGLMVQDVYLHRSIAERCVASLEVHAWTPGDGPTMARWSTRVPGGPALINLGRGLASARCAAWERHAELVRYGFDHAGWDADDFVGYRCVVEHPLWRCSYHFLFDFAGR